MKKGCTEEFYEKMENFVTYTEKMKNLINITKGHKQRFINMIIEFLKIKEKTPEIQKWINYIIIFNQKEINKYKKVVDEPVFKKLEQLSYMFFNFNSNPPNENINKDFSLLIEKDKPITIGYKSAKLTIKEKLINLDLNEKQISNSANVYLSKHNKLSNEIKQEKKEDKQQIDNNLNISKLLNVEDEEKIRKKINKLIKKMNSFNSIKEFIMNSINKENKNNKIFCDIYSLTVYNLSQESEYTKIKLLLLICLIFPFISNKQKLQLLPFEEQFDEKLINFLKFSKLLNKSKNNNFSEYLLQSIINREVNIELLTKMFSKDLFISNEGELFELYQLYIISKIFNFGCIKEYLYKITFKIKFILNNYNDLYYHKICCNFDYLFKTLWRLKNFYTNIYQNKLINDENEEINYIKIYFDKEINNSGLIYNNNNSSINMLFSEEENNSKLLTKSFFKRYF